MIKKLLMGATLLAGAALVSLAGFTALETRRIEAAHPPTGRFVPIEGGRLHVTMREPTGPARGTVVLLHGATGNQADLMLSLGDRLAAQGFRVFAPDRPGHGWSDRPGGEADASPARQAMLIRQGLETLGVRHAIILGHSWSGALAVNFALDQRDFTDGLVLVSPATFPWPGGVAWYYGPAASPLVGPLFDRVVTMPLGLLLFEAGVRAVFAPRTPPENFVERTGVELVLRPGEFMANAQDVDHLLAFVQVQAPRMGAVDVPTAIVTGDSDDIVSKRIHSDASFRVIPDVTLDVLRGVGHSPQWSEPGRVVEAVLSVADRIARRQAGPIAGRPAGRIAPRPAEAPHT